MECLKDCCKTLMKNKGKEQEIQVITPKMPLKASGLDEGKRGVSEDYLLSKLPPNGRVVPFVLPTFKASYIQPRGSRYPNLQSGPQKPLSQWVKPSEEIQGITMAGGSARCTYAERKAELLGSSQFTYSPEASFHQGQMAAYFTHGSNRRDTLKDKESGPQSPDPRGCSMKPSGEQRLSSSMFDLSSPHMQPFDLFSSRLSSTSSTIGSIESSLDSITLSGDERELGKVCVRLSYQEALEQVWITLVQCSINFGSDTRKVQTSALCKDGGEQPKIGFKGIITIPKPIQFKSSIKEYQQDVSFMETFVFALRLQQLRCSALVLRLQTHNPKKRTVAECVLSLRQLDSQETEHWLDLNRKSKSSVCHSELHLTTCFQPVNGRIQLQVLAAQNLPASSSPLTKVL
ncbi:hypothetical protein KUCAC02_035565 [Chaenocephalus aceratus]|nr:hypothetical protein KUCAC02_035565 [Chaenocephalus aceratus]